MEESRERTKSIGASTVQPVDSHHYPSAAEVAAALEGIGLDWATGSFRKTSIADNDLTESMAAVAASLAAAATTAYEYQTCSEFPNTHCPASSVNGAKNDSDSMNVAPHQLPPSDVNTKCCDVRKNTVQRSTSLARKIQLPVKEIISLAKLKQRIIDSSKGAISKYDPVKDSYCLGRLVNEYVGNRHEFSNIRVKHTEEEFFTFCSCPLCLQYREVVLQLMDDQLKARGMWEIFVIAISKCYQPMLKNATAIAKYDKLQESGDELSWLTCGYLYSGKTQHLNFIFDQSLTENMIFVLFSAILMVDNPHLLLQLLSFQIEIVVKAYAEGFLEIVEPDKSKIPAEEMLSYILDGYDELCRISENLSCFLFAFENDFMRKFGLTWNLLNQRLYQQHVYMNLTDTMLACIITLKEDELTDANAALIRKYIQFDDEMLYIDKQWTDTWIELNKFNLSESEKVRRKRMMAISNLFEVIPKDALELNAVDSQYIDITEWATHSNRQLVWQNLMAYTLRTWPESYLAPLNDYVCDDKCKNCSAFLEYHNEMCKCMTCSIAGGPQPPKRHSANTCSKCIALSVVENEVSLYESKILNVCASDDFLSFLKSKDKRKKNRLSETSSASVLDENYIDPEDFGTYHVSWALFRHLNGRKHYAFPKIDERYFCNNCKKQSCLLARKILNNEIAHALSLHLVRYYQPLTMTREELRAMLPNIMLYNRKMVSSTIGLDPQLDDVVVKIYWTFVISVFATYFVEFNENCPLRLDIFELANKDIKFNYERIIGNKDDTKFVQFLDKIKAFNLRLALGTEENTSESTSDVTCDSSPDRATIQKKMVEEYLKMYNEDHGIPSTPNENLKATHECASASISESNNSLESSKKSTNSNIKEKSKKCCFDHSDLGDHCKESHSTKKRIKKECNHARMNETRERLRKKLSQLLNARKNLKAPIVKQQQGLQLTNQLPVNNQQQQKNSTCPIKPTSKGLVQATTNIDNAIRTEKSLADVDDDSLECLNTLCQRISNLHTKNFPPPAEIALPTPSPFSNSTKKLSQNLVTNKASSKNKSSIEEEQNADSRKSIANARSTATSASSMSTVSSISTSVSSDDIQKTVLKANEINKLSGMDENKVKKWINERLSFIEGSKDTKNPINAKKAAKKAKQKQRKEETKRIAELQDYRALFHDIYFKEFAAKIHLKQMKSSKKRDKKKIAEFEANVKKLNRAKAKVETSVLELIATIKMANSDFKFSYLPTKEQQLEKLQQIQIKTDNAANGNHNPSATASIANLQLSAKNLSHPANAPNNLNNDGTATANYSLPYAHANNFPYPAVTTATDISSQQCVMPRLLSSSNVQMCYAPNQPSDIAMDPSKRIVTIRRINLPNVPEPQVTVTAKGSSPDQDKLLYTFVNGQLVQTTNYNIDRVENTTAATRIPPQTQHLQQQMFVQLKQSVPAPPLPLTKTQLKKERKKAKQLAAETEAQKKKFIFEQEEMQKKQQNNSKPIKSNTRQKSQNVCSIPKEAAENIKTTQAKPTSVNKMSSPATISSSASTTSVSTSGSNSTKKELAALCYPSTLSSRSSASTSISSMTSSSSASVSSCSQLNTRDNSVCSQKPNYEKQQHRTAKQEREENNLNKKCDDVPVSVKTTSQPQTSALKSSAQSSQVTKEIDKINKQRQQKFVDNGQFDNNQFKLLHLDDFLSESEVECDIEDQKADDCLVVQSQTDADVKKIDDKQQLPVCKKLQKDTENPCSKKSLPSITLTTKESTKKDQKPQPVKQTKKTALPSSVVSSTKPSNKSEERKSTVLAFDQKARSSRNTKDNKDIHQTIDKKQYKDPLPAASSRDFQRSSSSLSAAQTQKPINTKSIKNDSKYTANKRVNSASSISNTHSNSNAKRNQANPVCDKNVTSVASKSSKRSSKNANRSKRQISNSGTANCGNNNDNINSGIASKSNHHQQQQHQQSMAAHLTDCSNLLQIMPNPHNFQQQQHYQPQYTGAFHDRQHYTCQQSSIQQSTLSSNVSIMDQLSRGVQVENLSLPPGITLTKVDPSKSEQLRAKCESIKKLSKPLPQQSHQSGTAGTHHLPGATIIASGYYPSHNYGGSPVDRGGVIMVEAMPKSQQQNNCQTKSASAGQNQNKSSKNKKRKNKNKSSENNSQGNELDLNCRTGSKMVTLRNPMFHGGGPTIIQQQTTHVHKNLSVAAALTNSDGAIISKQSRPPLPIVPLPMDQPAAIIKNENGMFTIRNPALQQAVASGLSIGGYRQFNTNYYTPQEITAASAAVTSGSGSGHQSTLACSPSTSCSNNSFSYFSNSNSDERAPPPTSVALFTTSSESLNNRSAKMLNNNNSVLIGAPNFLGDLGIVGGNLQMSQQKHQLTNPSAPKCLSAIGSEVKSAQQQKKSKENQWTSFGQDLSAATNATIQENMSCGTYLGAVNNSPIQDKFQHKSYYNGFDVFPSGNSSSQMSTGGRSSNAGSLFDTNDCHVHHNCDDSPPPTITGFNHYLDGIPNTGVIRYDDAAFLKTLMPGQNLNNEVSIHNVNDSNFTRNATSPVAHRVEITPVYANRPASANMYECSGSLQQQQQYSGNLNIKSYRDHVGEYGNEHLFTPNNLLNLNDLDSGDRDVESFKRFDYDYEPPKEKQKVNININDLLLKKNSRASPYGDDETPSMDNFVQNMSTLNIADEQCSHLNGHLSKQSGTSSNGWW